jgi:hypothetical protein
MAQFESNLRNLVKAIASTGINIIDGDDWITQHSKTEISPCETF